jgi:hypothetical protein
MACKSVDLGYTTFNDWMKHAQEPDASDELLEFSHQIRQAEARCIDRALETIKGAIVEGNVSAAQWFLERRERETYGKNETIDLKNQHSGELKLELKVDDCSDDV